MRENRKSPPTTHDRPPKSQNLSQNLQRPPTPGSDNHTSSLSFSYFQAAPLFLPYPIALGRSEYMTPIANVSRSTPQTRYVSLRTPLIGRFGRLKPSAGTTGLEGNPQQVRLLVHSENRGRGRGTGASFVPRLECPT